MKTTVRLLLSGLFVLTLVSPLRAQPFDSGSTGKDGALNVTEDTTLDLPPDGIFHFTTITVAAGKTLRFSRNALNTPVYMLAQGEVSIEGTIDVSGSGPDGRSGGKGGPGGFDGGDGGFGGNGLGGTGRGADGSGPGGGAATDGRDFGGSAAHAGVYGNASLFPLVGGSGGGGVHAWAPFSPGRVGGGGGGAILVESNTKITLNGRVDAGTPGVINPAGSGSGGAIRLVAPLVAGTGVLDTAGDLRPGGSGRLRIDCLDPIAVRSLKPSWTLPSRGSHMVVFLKVTPRLDITEAAGQTIPAPAATTVSIQLPQGAPVNHVVKVQATGFTNAIPIRVVVVPSDRPSASYDSEIPASDAGPVTVSVNVVIPADSTSRIYAWTR